jgi:hypothetical protein
MHFRWPTKLAKFGIQDPLLRVLVTKYESEIPWQRPVHDESTLREFVATSLLPRLTDRGRWPAVPGASHLFVEPRHVDLEAMLRDNTAMPARDREALATLRQRAGPAEARQALCDKVNTAKAKAFSAWLAALRRLFPGEPPFWVLVLRPVFELAGRGSRRTLPAPNPEGLKWLHQQLAGNRLSPHTNLARAYYAKLALGDRPKGRNGWYRVPQGVQHVDRLTSLCQGSGWCIASPQWARNYLSANGFYLLLDAGRPVVALRALGQHVVECQGRNNQSPTGWSSDIALFLRTRGMTLSHREHEISADREIARLSLIDQPLAWWQARVARWPYALCLAPDLVREALLDRARAECMRYASWPDFNALNDLAGLAGDCGSWIDTLAEYLRADPALFELVPKELRNDAILQECCLHGWIDRVEADELLPSELADTPTFVRQAPAFQDALRERMPSALKTLIRRRRSAKSERDHPFNFNALVPPLLTESVELAVERVVHALLNATEGHFVDAALPWQVRRRSDFADVRREGWLQAFQASAPLWFALPADLRGQAGFALETGTPKRVDLDACVLRVLEKPWLLTQQAGVPKAVQRHERVVEAYREGWEAHIRANRGQTWVELGQLNGRAKRQVHPSPALLADPRVRDVVAESLRAPPLPPEPLPPRTRARAGRRAAVAAVPDVRAAPDDIPRPTQASLEAARKARRDAEMAELARVTSGVAAVLGEGVRASTTSSVK